MPLYKLSSIFQLTTAPTIRAAATARTAGWSESFWTQGDPAVFNNLLPAVRTARATFLPTQASIVGSRSQTYTISGNKLIPGGTSSGGLLYPGNFGYQCDIPNMNLEIPVQGLGVPNKSRLNLRGIPDQFVVTGEFSPNRDFLVAMQAFFDALRVGGLTAGFVGRNLTVGSVRVTMFKPAAGANPAQVTTDAAIPGFADGSFLRFHRCYDDQGNPIKGSFVATSAGGNVYNLQNGPSQTLSRPSGLIRVDSLQFIPFGSFSIGEIGTRKVGRPFRGFRGRRSKTRV